MRNLSMFGRVKLALKLAAGVFSSGELASAAHGLLAGVLAPYNRLLPPRSTRGLIELYNTCSLLRMVEGKIGERWAAIQWGVFAPARGRRGQRNLDRVRMLQRMPLATRSVLRVAMTDEGDLEAVAEHPLLSMINDPNPIMTGGEFRQLHSIYLDIAGECYWIMDVNGAGAPYRAWPIHPAWVESIPGPGRPEYVVNAEGWRTTIPEEYLLYFRQLNPTQPYDRGSGTGRALIDELETHTMGTKMVKGYFLNDGTPRLLVHSPNLEKPAKDKLEQGWLDHVQGYMKKNLPLFLKMPADATIKEFDQDFRSAQTVQLLDRERDLVLQVFGSSPEIHGILENSNRATSEVADYHFDKGVIVPRCERFREAIQKRLMIPRYDPRLLFDFEDPLKDDPERQLSVLKEIPAAFELDEIREKAGFEPKVDGSGKCHLVPIGTRLVFDLRETKPVAPPEGQPEEDDLEIPPPAAEKAHLAAAGYP